MNHINPKYSHTLPQNRHPAPCTSNSNGNVVNNGFQQLINDVQKTQAALSNNLSQQSSHDSPIQQPFHDLQGHLVILARILIAEIIGKGGRVDLDFSDGTQNNNKVFTAQELIADAERLAGLR